MCFPPINHPASRLVFLCQSIYFIWLTNLVTCLKLHNDRRLQELWICIQSTAVICFRASPVYSLPPPCVACVTIFVQLGWQFISSWVDCLVSHSVHAFSEVWKHSTWAERPVDNKSNNRLVDCPSYWCFNANLLLEILSGCPCTTIELWKLSPLSPVWRSIPCWSAAASCLALTLCALRICNSALMFLFAAAGAREWGHQHQLTWLRRSHRSHRADPDWFSGVAFKSFKVLTAARRWPLVIEQQLWDLFNVVCFSEAAAAVSNLWLSELLGRTHPQISWS